MSLTFGDRFEAFELDVKRSLLRRFKGAAKKLLGQYGGCDLDYDDLVQEAFAAILPKNYDLDPSGSIAVIYKIMQNIIFDEKRRRKLPVIHDDEEYEGAPVDLLSAEQRLIDSAELSAFISETESMVTLLESILRVRRRDFRERVRKLFDAFCSNPDKYVYFPETGGPSIRIRASELAADLHLSENAYQQFKARVDAVLSSAGLSLDRLLLGIVVHDEARETGLAPKALRIKF